MSSQCPHSQLPSTKGQASVPITPTFHERAINKCPITTFYKKPVQSLSANAYEGEANAFWPIISTKELGQANFLLNFQLP